MSSSIHSLQLPKRVAIVYSEVREEYFPSHAQFVTEQYARRDAELTALYVEKLGSTPILYPANSDLSRHLIKDRPDVIFNMACSIKGKESLSAVLPGLYELLDIPFTGTTMQAEILSYDKFLTKKLLLAYGIPIPVCQLFATLPTPRHPDLHFPIITKLNEIHGVVEITADAVSETETHLYNRIQYLCKTYKQPVIAEQFIEGREFTAIVLEKDELEVFLFENIINKKTGKYTFTSFELSWQDTDTHVMDTVVFKDPHLEALVKKAYMAVRMRSYGKFDIRMDAHGNYYFIDSNTNPFLAPKEAECPIAYMLEMYGLQFENILSTVLRHAMLHYKPAKK